MGKTLPLIDKFFYTAVDSREGRNGQGILLVGEMSWPGFGLEVFKNPSSQFEEMGYH